MKKRWVKDYCPYAKDQGFLSVIGDVAPGEQVFGFTYLTVGGDDVITFATETHKRVTQMKDTNYRVQLTKVTAASGASEGSEAYVRTQTAVSFVLIGDTAQLYDVIVIGRINY